MSKLKENDSLKLQLIELVKVYGKNIASAARELGLKPRQCQEFFAKEKQWMKDWWDAYEGCSPLHEIQKKYLTTESPIKLYGGVSGGGMQYDPDDVAFKKSEVVITDGVALNADERRKRFENYSPSARKVYNEVVNKFSDEMIEIVKEWEDKQKPKLPRILVIDIETKYLLMEGWGMFNQNFSVDQISEDWSILSYSAKWYDSDEVMYSDISEKTEDDILQELHDLLDEADFAIAHNGKRFDLKKIRARMITRGFKPYSPVRVIDTLEVAKTEFAFTSNKLIYLTRLLCKKHQKSDHGKFSGHMLWKEFLKGNPEAILEMREYNMLDVTSLQELYDIMAPWSSKHPNFAVYQENINLNDWEEYGYCYTNLAKYQQYRHKVTGQFRRGRTNLLTKEQRKQLLANIA